MRAALVLMLAALPCAAQLRQYVDAPYNAFPPEAKRAAVNLFEMRWQESLRDTAVLCFIGQSVWFRRDSADVEFRVDSIQGRGDRRQAKVTRRFFWRDSLVDSLSHGLWLGYTRRVASPDWGWYLPADSTTLSARLNLARPGWVLSVWMEKVVGDPTLNYGREQRAMLHMIYREQEPAWWRAYADSVRSLP